MTLSHRQLNTILSINGAGTEPHMCSHPHVLFCCVSTLFIIPGMMYVCGVPSVREALGRQPVAEVLEGRELEQDFERWAGLFVRCNVLIHRL